MIEAGGRLAQTLGIPRSTGQIYGLLYLSTHALSLDDMAELLRISKASASTGTRQLASFGAIRQIWIQGDRKDYYEVIADMGTLVRAVLDGFLKPRLRSSDRRTLKMPSTLEQDLQEGRVTAAEYELIKDRLAALTKFQKKVDHWLPMLEKFI